MKITTNRAFSVIELLMAIAIMGTLIAIAVPAYQDYLNAEKVASSKSDLVEISNALDRFYTSNNRFPDSLADVGMGTRLDPWDRPYHYLNLTNPDNIKDARKDRFLHPVNSDYDLYSTGEDGETKRNLNNSKSEDDVLRANNGKFYGLAQDY